MVALYFVVGGFLTYRRMTTLKQHPKGYFKLGRVPAGSSGEVPVKAEQASRNFSNLFEVPLLFFAAMFLMLELRIQNEITLFLSWCFVAGRIVHSFVHLSSNKVELRAICFWISSLFVLGLWIYLAARVFLPA